MRFKVIAISLIPNFGTKEITSVLGSMVTPWTWGRKNNGQRLKKTIEDYFEDREVALTDSGRTAIRVLLEAMEIKSGDEVIVQALTCSVVPGSIRAAGARVVYADIDKNYNIDPKEIQKLITAKTRAVVVQHSFGQPAEIKKIKEICQKNKVMLIEDLAHGLGNSYGGIKLGQWGEAAILTFGRDKVISGLWGGAVLVKDKVLVDKVKERIDRLPEVSGGWIFKQLWYIPIMALIVKTYGFLNLGKGLHYVLRKLGWLSEAITGQEKQGEALKGYKGIADPLAKIILMQWEKMGEIIFNRRARAGFYAKELGEEFRADSSFLRYTTEVENPAGLRKTAAAKNIFLGDWYDQVVAPKSVNPANFGYETGSCPKAEAAAKKIINLPTGPNISQVDAREAAAIIKQWKLKKA